MVDAFAIGLTHFLLLVIALRLLARPDLDRDLPPASEAPAEAPPVPGAIPTLRRPAKGGANHA